MNNAYVKVIEISPCKLPEDSAFGRNSPRLEALKPDDYNEKFDAKTMAFDVFMSDDKLVFSGPPAFGLDVFFKQDNFYLNDEPVINKPILEKLDRTQRNWFYIDKKVDKFLWKYKDIEFNISVNSNMHDFFRNKKVLFTLSKNNKFEWIADWIKFYKQVHDIDAVLFYDNNSDNYTIKDLSDFLNNQNLNVDIILVPWNFKYGPQGGSSTGLKNVPWDSDFCQYGMMEHAKERFLKYALGVINVDIDELIVGFKSGAIFNDLINYPAIQIPGKWIEAIPLNSAEPARFNNFFYYNKHRFKSDYKWCICPQGIEYEAQWKVHTVKTKKLRLSHNYIYYHYMGVNYNWKIQRTNFINFDSRKHRLDEKLYEIISTVFIVFEKPKLIYELSFWEKFKKAMTKIKL